MPLKSNYGAGYICKPRTLSCQLSNAVKGSPPPRALPVPPMTAASDGAHASSRPRRRFALSAASPLPRARFFPHTTAPSDRRLAPPCVSCTLGSGRCSNLVLAGRRTRFYRIHGVRTRSLSNPSSVVPTIGTAMHTARSMDAATKPWTTV